MARKYEDRIRNVYSKVLDDDNVHPIEDFYEANDNKSKTMVNWELNQLAKNDVINKEDKNFSYVDSKTFVADALEYFENYFQREKESKKNKASENVVVEKVAAEKRDVPEEQDIDDDAFFNEDTE